MNITILSISGELLAFSGVCGGEHERSLVSNDKACPTQAVCILFIMTGLGSTPELELELPSTPTPTPELELELELKPPELELELELKI